jgi:hypothetical protein
MRCFLFTGASLSAVRKELCFRGSRGLFIVNEIETSFRLSCYQTQEEIFKTKQPKKPKISVPGDA